MEKFQVYRVYPAVPDALAFLETLARNIWWCWNHEAVDLFRRINPSQWDHVGQNPLAFLARISQRRFDALIRDESFMEHLDRVKAQYQQMMAGPPKDHGMDLAPEETIAYLSMEFGLHESLPFFAGGLGVLAGDFLKASSALGLPLTGIGLLFREGYFRQYLDHNGWQMETYPIVDIFDLPIRKVTDASGADLMIEISGNGKTIRACAWQINVGRICLLLLDTHLPENPEPVRNITARLYASHGPTRVAQEVLLGVGGSRLLDAMGISPAVCHMNEGHCAFAGLERTRLIMDQYGLDFEEARQVCMRSTVFTTHTPVSAGHDIFDSELIEPYLVPYAQKFGMDVQALLDLGMEPGTDHGDKFSMFVFGTCFSAFFNGVSRLHGQVARQMWQPLWPDRFVEEIPIAHVTNGIHITSYISHQKNTLLQRYLSSDWAERQWDRQLIRRIDNIDNSKLWHTHEMDRSNLIRKCRQALLAQYSQRNAPRNVLDDVAEALDHKILTLCFARRFATYKRAGLLLRDMPRLTRLITDQDRPVQLVFAGKAHPSDDQGKSLIQQIVAFARRHEVRHRVVFLEDYDINIARYMVQGGDVWLNTPRRPNEACGTSGMKAAANGGLNLSVLDGWWCEGYKPDRGWAIGNGEAYEDPDYQDEVESQALFNILENDVIPAFYHRRRGNPPEKWIAMMKSAMKMAILEFSSDHMVREYVRRFYRPALVRFRELTRRDSARARELAATLSRLRSLWHGITLTSPTLSPARDFRVGERFSLSLEVALGDLTPDEVAIQIFHGRLKGRDSIQGSQAETMTLEKRDENGCCRYGCTLTCTHAGRFGLTARVIPRGDEVLSRTPGLITWAPAPCSKKG